MASLLARRLDALEAVLGTDTTGLAVGRVCSTCGAHLQLDDAGPCREHRPLREAELTLLAVFVSPDD